MTLGGGLLVARGKLVPSPIAHEYRVRIEYNESDDSRPEVYIEEPQLSRRPQTPDTAIPHTYNQHTPGKERPCAFYPAVDWDGSRSIATTVVPWLMSWLLDYEIWQATGHWHGGGLHPNVRRVSKKRLKSHGTRE